MKIDAPPLEAVYRDAYPDAVARGLPLHITVLYPFVPRADLRDAELDRTRSVLERHRAFDFVLTRVTTFPQVVWLAPEPVEPFRALTHAVHAEFPDRPPYGGAFDDVVPHATLTSVREDELDAAVANLAPRVEPFLPLGQRTDAVTLLVEDEPDRWREHLRFTLPQ